MSYAGRGVCDYSIDASGGDASSPMIELVEGQAAPHLSWCQYLKDGGEEVEEQVDLDVFGTGSEQQGGEAEGSPRPSPDQGCMAGRFRIKPVRLTGHEGDKMPVGRLPTPDLALEGPGEEREQGEEYGGPSRWEWFSSRHVNISPVYDERYSRKVFLGRIWGLSEQQVLMAFRRFGSVELERPYNLSQGFVFVVFRDDSSVEQLISSCDKEGHKLMYQINIKVYPDRHSQAVEVRPWKRRWCQYLARGTKYLDTSKTVATIGLPKLLKSGELSKIMSNQFGGVVYAGIDTDDSMNYPTGMGIVTFFQKDSYDAALSTKFFDLQQQNTNFNRVSVLALKEAEPYFKEHHEARHSKAKAASQMPPAEKGHKNKGREKSRKNSSTKRKRDRKKYAEEGSNTDQSVDTTERSGGVSNSSTAENSSSTGNSPGYSSSEESSSSEDNTPRAAYRPLCNTPMQHTPKKGEKLRKPPVVKPGQRKRGSRLPMLVGQGPSNMYPSQSQHYGVTTPPATNIWDPNTGMWLTVSAMSLPGTQQPQLAPGRKEQVPKLPMYPYPFPPGYPYPPYSLPPYPQMMMQPQTQPIHTSQSLAESEREEGSGRVYGKGLKGSCSADAFPRRTQEQELDEGRGRTRNARSAFTLCNQSNGPYPDYYERDVGGQATTEPGEIAGGGNEERSAVYDTEDIEQLDQHDQPDEPDTDGTLLTPWQQELMMLNYFQQQQGKQKK